MGHGGFKVDETDRCTFACGKTAQYLRQYSSGSWERVGKYAGRCALAGPEPEAEPEPALDHGDPVQSELEPGPHSEVIEKADDGLMFSLEEELHDGLLRTLTPAGGLAAEDSPALDSLDVVPTEQKEGDWCEGRRVFWPRARTEADFAIAV